MAKVRRTWKSVGFRPFGKDIMVMDPAMADHEEAVNKLARKLGLPQRLGSRRDSREWPPRLACPANPKLSPRIQSGRCPQGSLTVSGRFRRTPGAAITDHVAGSYTFTGSDPCSGLDLSVPMFAPCLLGCPGTGRQDPVLMSLRLTGSRYSSACHSIPVTQVFKKLPLLIRGFGVQSPWRRTRYDLGSSTPGRSLIWVGGTTVGPVDQLPVG
jgi:hypothetical protein